MCSNILFILLADKSRIMFEIQLVNIDVAWYVSYWLLTLSYSQVYTMWDSIYFENYIQKVFWSYFPKKFVLMTIQFKQSH